MAGVLDRVALVTGAGSAEGIGFATAKVLAAAGACVTLTATTKRIFERLETQPGPGWAREGRIIRRRITSVQRGDNIYCGSNFS